MFLSNFLSRTAFSGSSVNLDLLDVLSSGAPEQLAALGRILGEDARRRYMIGAGACPMSFTELSTALQGLEAEGFSIDPKRMTAGASDRYSPFRQQAFYDHIRTSADAAEELQQQLRRLNAECKKEQGFLKRAFGIFSHPTPVEKVTADVASFDRYCRKNGIRFDPETKELVAGEKPPSMLHKVKEARFLLAAVGGAALGLAGLNLAALPLLGMMPGLFFGYLPWLAAPFIGLNIFKSFSEYSIKKESPTLLRFGAITGAGLAISLGVVGLMTGLMPPLDPSLIQGVATQAAAAGGFNPMQYMLPIVASFTGAALAYKRAKAVVAGTFNDVAVQANGTGKLSRIYNKAVGLVMNKYTAPVVVAAGKLAEKGTSFVNKAFPRFIDVVGLPAVAVLLSATMATGGLGLLGVFAGYYATAFTGLAVGALAMAGAYYALGCRKKDFQELLSAAATGFSISSSSATMPKERECLKHMGVSKKTRDTVVPLGGVFNMYGTSLYMGLTAFYATAMFSVDPTMMTYLATAGTVMAIALGAPGIPASNVTLLEPVLRQTGLEGGQISKIYAMVLPADRILDMTQTGLNVLGDMLAATHEDRHKLRYVRVKHMKQIHREKLAKAQKHGL